MKRIAWLVVAMLCVFLALASSWVGGRVGSVGFVSFGAGALIALAWSLEDVFPERGDQLERRLDRW